MTAGIWVCIALGGVLIALILLLYIRYANVKQTTKSIAQDLAQHQMQPVRLAAPDKEFEKLLLQVNALIEYTGQTKVDADGKEIALRDEFARATHDLRTPLTSILGYLQLAQKEETDDATKAEYMRIAYERAQNLQMRIDGLYEITKLEAQNETELARVNLRTILLDLTAAYYFDFNEENRSIELEMPEQITDIYADAEAVKRILDNVYKNALLHGVGNVWVHVVQSAEHITIEISNKTMGLKHEHMPHLFDRFYTADISRSKGNSGLGLSIVRALVLQMGGEGEALLENDVFTMRLVLPKAKHWQ